MATHSYFSSFRHRSFSQSQPVCSPRKTELSEIDFAYELIRMLLPDRPLSDYFTEDSQRRIRLANGYNVNASALNIGRKFIPDILEGCSECREKLMTIHKFLSAKVSDDQLAFVTLMGPIKAALKKFLANTSFDIQKRFIESKDLSSVNKFVFDLRTQLGKIHNFYNVIFNASNLTIDAQLEILQKIWDEFLYCLGVFTCNLDDKIPLWELLFAELLNILGTYLESVFLAKTTKSTNSEVEQKNSIPLETYLAQLWTPNAKTNMELCVRYVVNLNKWKPQYRVVELNQITFKQLVSEAVKYSHPDRDNHLKMLTDLMERVTFLKKQQYADYIFKTIQSGEELKNTLNEIKGFYTLRILAPFIADYEHKKVLPPQAEEYLLRTAGVVLKDPIHDLNDTANSSELTSPKKWALSIIHYDNVPIGFKLKHKLELPLMYVFDDEFWRLLNECFNVCQDLLCAQTQMSEVIVFGALRDRNLQCRDVRMYRYIARCLLNLVSDVYSKLHSHLDEKINKYCKQLVRSTSLAQVEQVVEQWKIEFRRVLDKEGRANGIYINATVTALCGKVREFGLQFGNRSQSSTTNGNSFCETLPPANEQQKYNERRDSILKEIRPDEWLRSIKRLNLRCNGEDSANNSFASGKRKYTGA